MHAWVRTGASAAVAVAAAVTLQSQQRPGYVYRVDVSRVIVDVRVVDGSRRPITDLRPEHFRVKIDGEPARIEAARWETGATSVAGVAAAASSEIPPDPPGRLVVFFFQKSFEATRMVGLMQMLPRADEFLARLEPWDRVAVVSYDLHLKLWMDFSLDRDALGRILGHDLLMANPPPFDVAPAPSLFAQLAPAQARRVASPEDALKAVADALAPLPGPKSLVLIAYGFGRLSMGRVQMEPSYDKARDALLAARVTVFAIDVTQADYHSLQEGLETVAEDTGGFYASSFLFPGVAMQHLERALTGHYVLVVENPLKRPGRHRLDVDLVGRRGQVFARRTFVD